MRKLTTVRTVSIISPIEGADNIELAHIDGWQCVVKKGEFKVGSPGVYFEVDSFVPTKDPRFEFLEKSSRDWQGLHGAVIRTMKLRGQLSQGLLLPLRSFPELEHQIRYFGGDYDFSEDLGVYKYEKVPEEPVEVHSSWWHKVLIKYLPRSWRKSLFQALRRIRLLTSTRKTKRGPGNNFPSFLVKSDEERVQNLWSKKGFEEKKKLSFEVTMKLDGSSGSYYWYNGEFGLCSRNVKRGLGDGSHFAYIAEKYNFPAQLQRLGLNIQLLGEVMGPGIQGNRENLVDFDYFLYNVYDIDAKRFYGREEREELVTNLRANNCPIRTVPFFEVTSLERFNDIDSILKYAEGKSLNHPIREGMVFKEANGTFSFKVINNVFLLKEKD